MISSFASNQTYILIFFVDDRLHNERGITLGTQNSIGIHIDNKLTSTE